MSYINRVRNHWELLDVSIVSSQDGVEVGYHGLIIGVIEILSPGHYKVNGMEYDRLHMAIRDVVKKYWMEQEIES